VSRPFWKGTLAFGLVEIPVALRGLEKSDDLAFNLVDRKDFSPVGNRRYNKKTGKEVPWERVIRAYEFEPDRFVVLSDAELKRADSDAARTIEIVQFVEREAIEPAYFETPYLIEPLKKGSRSYALLCRALEKSGRTGIARLVLRAHQHVAAVMARDNLLVVMLLRYPHEIAVPKDLEQEAKDLGRIKVNPAELKLAEQLIDGMTGEWKPAQFKDEYREHVLALVQKKVKSGRIHEIDEAEPDEEPRAAKGGDVVDLVPLLKQSLGRKAGAGRLRSVPAPRKRARA
jgi:DNA end-binding protein Ku